LGRGAKIEVSTKRGLEDRSAVGGQEVGWVVATPDLVFEIFSGSW